MIIAPLNKYQSQPGCKARLYEFNYSCYLNLPSGKKFKRTGIVKALHQRQAKELVNEKHDCHTIIVNPNLKGKAFSSDVAFGVIAIDKKRYRDVVN